MDEAFEHTVDHEPIDASSSSGKKRSLLGRFRRRRNVVLVTSAKRSAAENLHHREVVYAWLQGSRIPLLLLCFVSYVWLQNVLLSVILFLVSIPMPWIAVVIANGAGEPRDPRAPAVYKPALARMQAEQEELQRQQAKALEEAPSSSNLPAPMVIDAEDFEEPEGPK